MATKKQTAAQALKNLTDKQSELGAARDNVVRLKQEVQVAEMAYLEARKVETRKAKLER